MSYGLAADEAERLELGKIIGLSFAMHTGVREWMERAGVDHVRVVRKRRGVVGGLLLVPMGQFFGGRSVPMTGIAAVCMSPTERGGGVATELMHRAMHELHEQGTALSALYPATMPLYRRAGFEVAGGIYRVGIAGKLLDAPRSELEVEPVAAGDRRELAAIYHAYAHARSGWLDRGEYVWERTRRDEPAAPIIGHALVLSRREGYVFYRQKPVDMGYKIRITDMAARTPRALRSLLAFLGRHRSLADEVHWFGGADEPLVALFREHRYEVRLHHHFMLRVTHVREALARRGYPAGLSLSVDIDVSDDVIDDNGGSYRLEVENGTATVRRGRGGARLDVRALAALYSGHLSAEALAAMGRLEARPAVLARLSALFAGPAPSMADFF